MRLFSNTMTGLLLLLLAASLGRNQALAADLEVRLSATGRADPPVGTWGYAPGESAKVVVLSEMGFVVSQWEVDQAVVNNPSPSEIDVLMDANHELDVTLTPRDPATIGSLQGTVRSASDGTPVTCAAVVALGPGGIAVANTDVLGFYFFTGLVAGSWFASVHSTCCEAITFQQVTVVSQTTGVLDFSLQPRLVSPTVAGTVTDLVTGLPIGGVHVRALDGSSILDTTYTCATGEYALTFGISPVNLEYSAAGYESKVRTVSVPVKTITVDESLEPKAQLPGQLNGTITDAFTSLGLSGVQIKATFTGTTNTIFTSPGGTFAIPGLEAGTYTVAITKDGYQGAYPPPAVLVAGASATVNFALIPVTSGGGNGTNGGCVGGVIAPNPPGKGGDMILLMILPAVVWAVVLFSRRGRPAFVGYRH